MELAATAFDRASLLGISEDEATERVLWEEEQLIQLNQLFDLDMHGYLALKQFIQQCPGSEDLEELKERCTEDLYFSQLEAARDAMDAYIESILGAPVAI